MLKEARTPYKFDVGALELDDPDLIIGHGSLSRHEQAALAGGSAKCRPYNQPAVDVPLVQLRLILDTQITKTDHAETIMEPRERQQLAQHLRDFMDGCDVYGQKVLLAETPVDASLFPTGFRRISLTAGSEQGGWRAYFARSVAHQ